MGQCDVKPITLTGSATVIPIDINFSTIIGELYSWGWTSTRIAARIGDASECNVRDWRHRTKGNGPRDFVSAVRLWCLYCDERSRHQGRG
jgi:hypothetical protein